MVAVISDVETAGNIEREPRGDVAAEPIPFERPIPCVGDRARVVTSMLPLTRGVTTRIALLVLSPM